ncbi:MAG: DUF3309 family protein [Rhodocyclaceae bacterium]
MVGAWCFFTQLSAYCRTVRCFVLVTVRRNAMSLGTILLVVLILMLIGAIPRWPHSQSWGYAPTGGIGLLVLIVIILLVLGKL